MIGRLISVHIPSDIILFQTFAKIILTYVVRRNQSIGGRIDGNFLCGLGADTRAGCDQTKQECICEKPP